MSATETERPGLHQIGGVPVPEKLLPAAIVLWERHYQAAQLANAIAYIETRGTTEGAEEWIDAQTRAFVEAVLPTDPAWDSEEWNQGCYGITDPNPSETGPRR